jgi:hypothetical protein
LRIADCGFAGGHLQQDVGGLQVPVEDAALVRMMHAPRHLGQPARGDFLVIRNPQSAIRNPPGEAAALDQFHREVVPALVLADLVDRDDVRVVEAGGRLGLGLEALDVTGRRELAGEDHLQGDGTVEAHLPRPVHDAHAAAGDDFQQFVVADVADRRPRHGSGGVLGAERGRLGGGRFDARLHGGRLRRRREEVARLGVSA